MDQNTKLRLLRIRTVKKKQKPIFVRDECWRYKRVAPIWRKARGIDSKTRRKTKSGVVSPHIGFRGPRLIRGYHPTGLIDVRINTKADLKDLDKDIHGIRIAKKIGAKRRIELIEFVREQGFHVLNMGISKKELKEIEEVEEQKPEDQPKKSAKQEQIEKLKISSSTKAKEEENADVKTELEEKK